MSKQQNFNQTQNSHQALRLQAARGFTVAEVMLALTIFTLMILMFGAVYPMMSRGAQYSGNYSQGAMIAQHKMDQLRSAGFSRLDLRDLSNLTIVDTTQPAGYPMTIRRQHVFFHNHRHLVTNSTTHGYFAPGSPGTVTVVDYAVLHPSSGIPTGTMALVMVRFLDRRRDSDGNYKTSALLAKAVP